MLCIAYYPRGRWWHAVAVPLRWYRVRLPLALPLSRTPAGLALNIVGGAPG